MCSACVDHKAARAECKSARGPALVGFRQVRWSVDTPKTVYTYWAVLLLHIRIRIRSSSSSSSSSSPSPGNSLNKFQPDFGTEETDFLLHLLFFFISKCLSETLNFHEQIWSSSSSSLFCFFNASRLVLLLQCFSACFASSMLLSLFCFLSASQLVLLPQCFSACFASSMLLSLFCFFNAASQLVLLLQCFFSDVVHLPTSVCPHSKHPKTSVPI
jgi:hypothetical protein